MIYQTSAGKSFINEGEYRDKVLGCWTGKNIGGTLGAPMEGSRELFDVSFYVQDLKGKPAPNDDLDLQLAWLRAVEDYGLFNVNERVLGEYWLRCVCGPWNEYGVCKYNMQLGLMPPLSGSVNNDRWKNSNGAWIRSEIWACLFPGEPDYAIHYAWYDACVDHADEGIYAEIFTVSLESAAFIESDVRKLIDMALVRIPEDSRVARSVKIVLDAYDQGKGWKDARNLVVKDSEDLGWFMAPANVAFAVLGLVYGEGDFGRSVCLAVNCGDDTDCSGATCGAVMGIIQGRSHLPAAWIEPIGETIETIAVQTFRMDFPKTLDELTNRVIHCKRIADLENPALLRLTSGETFVDDKTRELLMSSTEAFKYVLSRSSTCLEIEVPYGHVFIRYAGQPVVAPGGTLTLSIAASMNMDYDKVWDFDWHLPDGWSVEGGNAQSILVGVGSSRSVKVVLHAGAFSGPVEFIPVYMTYGGRRCPNVIMVPVQCEGAVGGIENGYVNQEYYLKAMGIKARF